MQANYPEKSTPTHWDPVRLNYPVRKFPDTGVSSETIGRYWRSLPDVIHELKTPIKETLNYSRDYNVTKDLSQSQTTVDYGYRLSETERFNKHTSCHDNLYIYPTHRKLADRPPPLKAHYTSEMKTAFTVPNTSSRLVTDKDQFKLHTLLPLEPRYMFHEDVEPIDTTYEGFEKYLDPYLTTNRLHHRPFTANQLCRASNSKDVVTYYTYANSPWVRSPNPSFRERRLPISKAKSVFDREKFKQGCREIRTHNKPNWIPRSFHTETRNNYVDQSGRPGSHVINFEEEVRSHCQRSLASLQTNIQQENSAMRHLYNTESSHIGSRKPLCSVLDQCVEKNRRLVNKNKISDRSPI